MEARIAMRIGIMSHHGQKIVPIPRVKIPKVESVPATDAINGRPTERRVSAVASRHAEYHIPFVHMYVG